MVSAERLMDGHAEFFGVARGDMVHPDWSFDPRTSRWAHADACAYGIDCRDELAVGDGKQLWELSCHHHITVLATAFALTGDGRYAFRVANHLKSWGAADLPLRRMHHWIRGIELGIRLLSWVWVRRLLDHWPGAPDLFEGKWEVRHQIYYHQRALPSMSSSANSHAGLMPPASLRRRLASVSCDLH